MSAAPRVCLVSASHLASNPRIVKEADALHAAGFAVTVVASDHYPPARELDATLLARAPWACVRLAPEDHGPVAAASKLRRAACLALVRAGSRNLEVASVAENGRHRDFAEAASRVAADLYIGHTASGLAAAGAAARRTGARLGFDAEDWHRREQLETERRPGLTRSIEVIEDALVPLCAHLTAASPLIGEKYAALWGRPPVTILNVFPSAWPPASPTAPADRIDALYWFSQTIGPDRGIEAVLPALALLPRHWELHLRGTPAPGYSSDLGARAAALSLAGRLKWLPPAAPDRLPALAAPYAAGLAIELTAPENRGLCLTNKIFTYVLGGTPVILSDTPAHRLLAPDLGAAARVADLSQPRELADAALGLQGAAAHDAAWALGRGRFNWEAESAALVESVRRALAARPGLSPPRPTGPPPA
jgi:glycosyltransferase involved in cell wall biosynthesis